MKKIDRYRNTFKQKKSKKKTLYTRKIKVEKEKGWSQKQINEIVPMKVCIDIIVLCACV